jgi:hypothetical protein
MPAPTKPKPIKPRCGLCGKTKDLIQTECCGNWICNDAHEYVLFSYARNSCYRNHSRFTLCGYHSGEGHPGNWKDCEQCRTDFEPEMVAWYGTNEYNFEKMSDPPSFEPTKCITCGKRIILADGGFSHGRAGYTCDSCYD